MSRLVRGGADRVAGAHGRRVAVVACTFFPSPHLLCHFYHLGVGPQVPLGSRPLEFLPVRQGLLTLKEGRSWAVVGARLRP